jgi:hypothetical protein
MHVEDYFCIEYYPKGMGVGRPAFTLAGDRP